MHPSQLRDALGRLEELLSALEALAAGQAAHRFEEARARLELLDNQLGGLAWIIQDELVLAHDVRSRRKETKRCDDHSSRRWQHAS